MAYQKPKRISESGITLVYTPEKPKFSGKHFYFRFGEDVDGHPTITARDLKGPSSNDSYHKEITPTLENQNPNTQVIEVGAGLGELVEVLLTKNPTKKPIIIDPVNYNLLDYLLEQIRPEIQNQNHQKELETLQRRSRLYQNPQLVTHKKMKLHDALRDKSLHHKANLVVDNFGPNHWEWSVRYRGQDVCVRVAEGVLLAENGILIRCPGSNVYQSERGILIKQ